MGSRFVTKEQAAKVLDVSVRTISRYIRKGALQAECRGRRMLVNEEDVLSLKKGKRDPMSSSMTRDIIAKLQVEIQTLKTQMATVMKILNVRYDPLDLTIPEYTFLYQAAEQLSIDGWSPHMEEQWSEYFVRLQIEDLEKLEAVTNDPHPWRPILRLATTMHLNPYNKVLQDVLAAGRNNVHQVASVWCVLKEESPRTFDILLDRDTAPLKKLLRRLKKDQETEELLPATQGFPLR